MSQSTSPLTKYRLKNWPEYERALVQRGSLTVWFDPQVAEQWYDTQHSGRRDASRTYSDTAIQCVLTLQAVFSLPLRATQGLVGSLVQLMGLELGIPDHTTLSYRRATSKVSISRYGAEQARHVVIDSMGLKVFGEGEWKCDSGYHRRSLAETPCSASRPSWATISPPAVSRDKSTRGMCIVPRSTA